MGEHFDWLRDQDAPISKWRIPETVTYLWCLQSHLQMVWYATPSGYNSPHTNIAKKTCVTAFTLRAVGSSVIRHTQKHGCLLIQNP